MLLFTHPDLLKGVVINSGVYFGRDVDEDHLPFMNSTERASLPIKCIVGEEDRGYEGYSDNWQDTKAKLLRCGHLPSKIEIEAIRKGNRNNLISGHSVYAARILDFCSAVERGAQN